MSLMNVTVIVILCINVIRSCEVDWTGLKCHISSHCDMCRVYCTIPLSSSSSSSSFSSAYMRLFFKFVMNVMNIIMIICYYDCFSL